MGRGGCMVVRQFPRGVCPVLGLLRAESDAVDTLALLPARAPSRSPAARHPNPVHAPSVRPRVPPSQSRPGRSGTERECGAQEHPPPFTGTESQSPSRASAALREQSSAAGDGEQARIIYNVWCGRDRWCSRAEARQMMDARDDEANPILQRDVSRARRDRNRARMADLSDLSSEKYLLVSN
jgi:hypothetical protein